MAWTTTDLESIEKAIVSGQRRVRLNGREVEYHSIDQMLKARDAIRNGINQAASLSSGNTRPRSFRARTGKGL